MSTCDNNNEVAGKTPKRTHWATASLILCLAGWLCALLTGLHTYPASWYENLFVCAIVLWSLSLIFGIVALVRITRSPPVYRGVPEAVGGIVISGSPLVLNLGLIFLLPLAFGGRYDNSHPASILATIEDNSVVRFPENIESLKAADKTDRGIDSFFYVFILSFRTDQDGLAQIQESLSLLYDYREYEVVANQYADEYDQRRSQKGTPEWYRAKLPEGVIYTAHGKGVIYTAHGESRIGKFHDISCIWVVLAESEKVIVYMEGVGDYSLKDHGN